MIKHLTFVAVVMVTACTDDDPAPSVTVRGATPDSLTPDDDRLDDLMITAEYSDADGDLGGGTAEIHDCRDAGFVTSLLVPAIAPDDLVAEAAPITGTLELHVNDVGATTSSELPATCADLGVAELAGGEAVFCVILVDAAGHRGAGDCTGAIAIE